MVNTARIALVQINSQLPLQQRLERVCNDDAVYRLSTPTPAKAGMKPLSRDAIGRENHLSTPTPANAGMKPICAVSSTERRSPFNSHSSKCWNETCSRCHRAPKSLVAFNSHSSKCWNETALKTLKTNHFHPSHPAERSQTFSRLKTLQGLRKSRVHWLPPTPL